MYTSKSVSQRSAIFNPEEIRTDRLLFSLDRIFVKACQYGTPRNVLRPMGRGSRIHSPFFNISELSSIPIIDVLLFLLEDSLWRVCEKLHFRTRFQGTDRRVERLIEPPKPPLIRPCGLRILTEKSAATNTRKIALSPVCFIRV